MLELPPAARKCSRVRTLAEGHPRSPHHPQCRGRLPKNRREPQTATLHFRAKPLGVLPCRFAHEPVTATRWHVRVNLVSDVLVEPANAFICQVLNVTHATTFKISFYRQAPPRALVWGEQRKRIHARFSHNAGYVSTPSTLSTPRNLVIAAPTAIIWALEPKANPSDGSARRPPRSLRGW
jgi:hypothetical protein